MSLSLIHEYLLIINIIGLVLYLINQALYRFTASGQIDLLVTIACLLGGSIGVLIPVLIMHRKLNKDNEQILMSSVFLYCIIPIQIIIYLIIRNGVFSIQLSKITNFFKDNKWLLTYLLIINVITFITYGIDKLLAIKEKSRIKIISLLFLSFIGGEIGGFIAMKLFRHKINKDYFSVGLPLIFIMHIVILIYMIFK
jgi:uncharacterized membrane protein YsdA (DUF1294 family)